MARATGAANTLIFSEGRIDADNTDGAGFLAALRERAPEAEAGMAAVLGAGGAARGVVYALLEAGAAGLRVEPAPRTSASSCKIYRRPENDVWKRPRRHGPLRRDWW